MKKKSDIYNKYLIKQCDNTTHILRIKQIYSNQFLYNFIMIIIKIFIRYILIP